MTFLPRERLDILDILDILDALEWYYFNILLFSYLQIIL